MQVAFALFGFLPGSVGLRGKFTSEGNDQATVKVLLL